MQLGLRTGDAVALQGPQGALYVGTEWCVLLSGVHHPSHGHPQGSPSSLVKPARVPVGDSGSWR